MSVMIESKAITLWNRAIPAILEKLAYKTPKASEGKYHVKTFVGELVFVWEKKKDNENVFCPIKAYFDNLDREGLAHCLEKLHWTDQRGSRLILSEVGFYTWDFWATNLAAVEHNIEVFLEDLRVLLGDYCPELMPLKPEHCVLSYAMFEATLKDLLPEKGVVELFWRDGGDEKIPLSRFRKKYSAEMDCPLDAKFHVEDGKFYHVFTARSAYFSELGEFVGIVEIK